MWSRCLLSFGSNQEWLDYCFLEKMQSSKVWVSLSVSTQCEMQSDFRAVRGVGCCGVPAVEAVDQLWNEETGLAIVHWGKWIRLWMVWRQLGGLPFKLPWLFPPLHSQSCTHIYANTHTFKYTHLHTHLSPLSHTHSRFFLSYSENQPLPSHTHLYTIYIAKCVY